MELVDVSGRKRLEKRERFRSKLGGLGVLDWRS